MIGLPGEQSSERDRKLDLEMGKIEPQPILHRRDERLSITSGVYLHEGNHDVHGTEDAHTAVAAAAHHVEPGALVLVFQKKHAVYSGSGRFRRD